MAQFRLIGLGFIYQDSSPSQENTEAKQGLLERAFW